LIGQSQFKFWLIRVLIGQLKNPIVKLMVQEDTFWQVKWFFHLFLRCSFKRKLFYKSNRKLFSCVCVASRVYVGLCKHGKRFLLLKCHIYLYSFTLRIPFMWNASNYSVLKMSHHLFLIFSFQTNSKLYTVVEFLLNFFPHNLEIASVSHLISLEYKNNNSWQTVCYGKQTSRAK